MCANSQAEEKYHREVEAAEKAREEWEKHMEEQVKILEKESTSYNGFDFSNEFAELMNSLI